MNKEQIRAYYQRFREWQQAAPHYVNRHEGVVQRCHNCGTEFAGNFCPICGQRAEVGRVGWSSIRENVALLWGLDSRSLTYTLVQLMGRPGYLVREYISGHRQMFIEDERGSVSVGKYADFLLVNKDVLSCPANEIHEAKPAATYFEGKKVYLM